MQAIKVVTWRQSDNTIRDPGNERTYALSDLKELIKKDHCKGIRIMYEMYQPLHIPVYDRTCQVAL